jgi:hypothetical protein
VKCGHEADHVREAWALRARLSFSEYLDDQERAWLREAFPLASDTEVEA